jgi:hypothetical protein
MHNRSAKKVFFAGSKRRKNTFIFGGSEQRKKTSCFGFASLGRRFAEFQII